MNRIRLHQRPLLLFVLLGLGLSLGASIGRGSEERLPAGMLIRVGATGKPEVVPVEWPLSPELLAGEGFVVWADQGRESWRALPFETAAPRAPSTLAMASRFVGPTQGNPSGAGELSATPTLQLDQLIGQVVFRGDGFLTPAHAGYHLDPKITIRRQPREEEPAYPKTTLRLDRGDRLLLRIPIEADQAKVAWSEIPDLPRDLEEGLPPGEYTLREEDGRRGTTFTVEDVELREWVMEVPDELERLLGGRQDPLYLQVTVGHLLGQVDEDGRPRPYTADALNLLEGAPEGSLTPYLRQLRADVLARLQKGPPAEPASAVADPTGIPKIDAARQLILVGKWDAALAELDAPELAGATRSKALATLYRAVIAAESGQTTEAASRALFVEAIEQLAGDPADAYRARNNYANGLLVRAQDRLYNHAFQIASGVSYPLIRSLVDWRRSLAEYEAALGLADELGPDRRAAVEMNMARLYALLADVIHTLDPPVAGERGFSAGHRAAASEAWRLASSALSRDGGPTDPVVRAAGYEILAQLAFRQGSAGECRRRIGQAMHEYLQVGALAGLEGGHRMLGLLCLREAEYAQDDASAAEGRKQALKHLKLSHFLAEFLREQIPADRIGLGRAGFFARRAYVNERLCELLIAQGEPAEALRYAELAKARGLEDVLAVGASGIGKGDRSSLPGRPGGCFAQIGPVPFSARKPRGLSEILADWPSDVAALEYFLGTEQAWLFVVDSSGEVTAHVLKDAWGRPLASRDLIARVRGFLVRTDHKASQMRERLASGMGFDHTWQYELYQLYRELVPEGVMDELREVKTVLIAPHHILHYFPFVALVTEPDTSPRAPDEMVRPRFLLDEAFNVCSVPSLSAWDLLRERPDRPIRQVTATGIVRFADVQPLPGVEKDLANLKAAFGEMVQTVVSDEEASEARAKEILNRSGLLFVATHGQSFADQPLSSYLMFHTDEHNDGYLTAREIYAQDVAADLVVMSACYSGLADRSPLPGDDLFGLQRALLYSGARSVVSGVWDVYDGTGPILMREFFRQLVAGQPVPAALSNAQRAMLNRLRATRNAEPWLHPYFWAVYTAVGDDRTRLDTGNE